MPDIFIELNKYENIIHISEELFSNLTKENAIAIADYYNHTRLIKLPEKEILFFEWLKINSPEVWNDLWNDDLNEPYIVSITHLPKLIYKEYKGFLICDLVNNDNYYFSPKMMVDEESKIMVESVKERYLNKEAITIAQLFALTVSYDETDIWHFAYKYDFDINKVKKAVEQLVEDNVLIHLTDFGHLATFLIE